MSEMRTVVQFLKIAESGEPYLEGHVCQRCDAIFLGARTVCSRCGARDRMRAKPLSNTGRLHTYSIVHRSFPGIAVPFVSAVVDLDGGGTVKGNLVHVAPDPNEIQFGMPVSVLYEGRNDAEGNPYLSYFFEPRGDRDA